MEFLIYFAIPRFGVALMNKQMKTPTHTRECFLATFLDSNLSEDIASNCYGQRE